MSAAFDAYHEWLGIPPKDQPPHHYRLLGLEPFEPNPKVIENAAEQRMLLLKTRQVGTHAAETQRLLNEISTARIALLDTEKKTAYDTALRSRMASSSGRPAAKPLPQAKALPAEPVPAGFAPIAPLPRVAAPPLWQSPAVLAGGAVVVLALALGGWWLLNQGPPSVAVRPPPNPAPLPAPPVAPSVDPQKPSPSPAANEKNPFVPTPAPMPEEPPAPLPPPAVEPVEPIAPVDPAIPDPAVPVAAASRTPIPPPEQAAKAEQEIKGLFANDLKNAKTAEQKAAFAEQLLRVAKEEAPGTATQYAALHLARTTAAAALSGRQIEAAVALLAEQFEVDAAQLRNDSLLAALDAPGSAAAKKPLLEAALVSADLLFEADEYVRAAEFLKALAEPAREMKDRELSQAVADRRKLGSERYAEFQKVQPALEKLKTSPEDAEANLAVGKYLLLVKEDAPAAFKHLAQGSDAKLNALAQAELAAPTEPVKQLSLADGWYDQIAAATGKDKTAYERRAALWYSEAVGGLTGLDRARADKRLQSPQLADHLTSRQPPVFLDDLQETGLELNMYPLGKHGRTGYPAPQPHEVLLQKKKIEHALSFLPESNREARLDYDINGLYTRFSGTVGLHDNFGYHTSLALKFRILGDGKKLWESKAISKANQFETFDVGIAGVRRLSLVVACPGSNEHAATVWLEPKLSPRPRAGGTAVAAEPKGASPPARSPVELLDFVNVDVHAVKQQWTRREKEVVAPQAYAPLLQIPVSILGSYELTVEFTRETGGDIVGVLLPVGDRYCTVLFSTNGGEAGFVGADGDAKGRFAPSRLTTGKRYVLRAQVVVTENAATVDVSLDDTRLNRWSGVGSANDAGDRKMPLRRHIGLYAHESRTAFHSVKLKMLNGNAVPDANALAPQTGRPPRRPARGE